MTSQCSGCLTLENSWIRQIGAWQVTTFARLRPGFVGEFQPLSNCSSREGINSRCRRFDSICRRYDRSCCRSGCRRSHMSLAINYYLTIVVAVSTDRWRSIVQRRSFFWFFAYKKFAMPNWDANTWDEGMTVDTNGLRYLSRRSRKNCGLQFANHDRQTDLRKNYSIDHTLTSLSFTGWLAGQ